MRTRTLLFGVLLITVATAGCAARAGAPISAPHAAAPGEVGDPSADPVSAFEAAAGRATRNSPGASTGCWRRARSAGGVGAWRSGRWTGTSVSTRAIPTCC